MIELMDLLSLLMGEAPIYFHISLQFFMSWIVSIGCLCPKFLKLFGNTQMNLSKLLVLTMQRDRHTSGAHLISSYNKSLIQVRFIALWNWEVSFPRLLRVAGLITCDLR